MNQELTMRSNHNNGVFAVVLVFLLLVGSGDQELGASAFTPIPHYSQSMILASMCSSDNTNRRKHHSRETTRRRCLQQHSYSSPLVGRQRLLLVAAIVPSRNNMRYSSFALSAFRNNDIKESFNATADTDVNADTDTDANVDANPDFLRFSSSSSSSSSNIVDTAVSVMDMRREFDEIDINKNGAIDKTDISKRLAYLPMSIVDKLFAMVDTNNDGTIDFEEYQLIRTKMGVTTPRTLLFDFLNLPIVELLNALAVVLCSFLVAVSTLRSLPSVPIPSNGNGDGIIPMILRDILNVPLSIDGTSVNATSLINAILELFNIIFAMDFFLRWYAFDKFKPQYLLKPLVVLDVVVVLIPLTLQRFFPFVTVLNSPGLQNLLLLRILRLRRVLKDITTFSRFEMALGLPPQDVRPFQLQLARVLLTFITLLSVSSGLIYTTEHGVNPAIPDYFAALYFSLTTLTTVGFGDITPISSGGRLVVCVCILAGVAVIPTQAASLLDAILEYQNERKQSQEYQMERKQSQQQQERQRQQIIIEGGTTTTDSNSSSSKSISVPSLNTTRTFLTTEVEQEILLVQEEKLVTTVGKCCRDCEGIEHRQDATFCWSCGTELTRKVVD